MAVMETMKRAAMVVLVGMMSVAAGAQTLATGDTRTVTEPTFPTVCSTLQAQMAIVSGGPASETTPDTARIQAALTACPSGQAVELAGAGTNYAFVTAPMNIPSGVGLIIDGGVTLFASRFAADYQTSSSELCGTHGSSGNGCNTLFKFGNGSTNVGSGIYGYGVIDARGGSTILKLSGSTVTDTGISWWTNADAANTAGDSQDNPIIMKPSKSTNLTLYKITMRNSPMFHVGTSGISGFTVWGVKIQAPFTAHNTDGIDPQGTNVTITNSSISDGDDDVAVGASSASSNITISNVTTYSGHGVSVGSYTQGGLNNMLVKNVNMAGTAADGNSVGLRLKSAADRGAVVQNVTYQNVCIRDARSPLIVTALYNTNSGTAIPTFSNIVYQNVHVLPPTGTKYPYRLQLQGYDANHLATITWNNLVVESLTSSGFTFPLQYATISLVNNVYPSFLQTLSGTGITETGTATATTAGAYDCSATSTIFPYIVGELYLSTPTATNLQTASVPVGTNLTLNAMVQPAMSQATFNGTVGSYTGAAALTAGVNFYEGLNKVGTGTLSANGSLASVTLTNVTAGPHTYTAQYPGDANYGVLSFGSVTVNVSAATATALTTLTAPATGTFGNTTQLSVLVTGAGATPTGTVTFYDGAASLGTATLASGAASIAAKLTGGAHSVTAAYSGDTNYAPSTSAVSQVTIAAAASTAKVTANPATVLQNVSTNLTATITGVAGYAVPTGSVDFSDAGTYLGTGNLNSAGVATLSAPMATAGSRTITAAYSGDANYAVSSATTAVTVTVSSITTLTAPATAAYGAAQTLTATVTYPTATPTGNVTFFDVTTSLGVMALVNGTATLSNVKLAAGTHTLKAVYAGDVNAPASTSQLVSFVVTQATPTIVATANPTTVTVGGTTVLNATVTGVTGAAAATGTVDFTDGATDLGAIVLNGAGVSTLNAAMNVLGARTITATYSGDNNYLPTSGTVVVTVNSNATSTTLTVSPATTYPGTSVVLTAAVTPIGSGGVVTFLNGATVLGTGNVSATTGIATFTTTAGAVGTYSLTATVAAQGNYAASTSAAQTLTVLAAVTVTSNPVQVTIAPGSSATVSLSIAGGGGFTGVVTMGCASPVKYVTCAVSTPTITITGLSSQTLSGTITVATSTGSLRTPGIIPEAKGVSFAWLLPVGLLGLAGVMRKRKSLRGALLLAMVGVAGMLGAMGCGGGSNGAAGGSSSTTPTGSQTVTFTATANGATQSTPVLVKFQ